MECSYGAVMVYRVIAKIVDVFWGEMRKEVRDFRWRRCVMLLKTLIRAYVFQKPGVRAVFSSIAIYCIVILHIRRTSVLRQSVIRIYF